MMLTMIIIMIIMIMLTKCNKEKSKSFSFPDIKSDVFTRYDHLSYQIYAFSINSSIMFFSSRAFFAKNKSRMTIFKFHVKTNTTFN